MLHGIGASGVMHKNTTELFQLQPNVYQHKDRALNCHWMVAQPHSNTWTDPQNPDIFSLCVLHMETSVVIGFSWAPCMQTWALYFTAIRDEQLSLNKACHNQILLLASFSPSYILTFSCIRLSTGNNFASLSMTIYLF